MAPRTITAATKADYPNFNAAERWKLAVLERRFAFLVTKTADSPKGAMGHEKAEMSAFEWVFELIQAHHDNKKPELKPHQCCQEAKMLDCVCCTWSYTCPTHGDQHVGTHD